MAHRFTLFFPSEHLLYIACIRDETMPMWYHIFFTGLSQINFIMITQECGYRENMVPHRCHNVGFLESI